MKNDRIVTLNGQRYDSVSGKSMAVKKPTDANSIHSLTQKSQTLYRRGIKKPIANSTSSIVRKVGRNMDIARSKNISHFSSGKPSIIASHPITKKIAATPERHPLVLSAEKKHVPRRMPQSKPTAVIQKTAKEIKESAIAEAMSRPIDTTPKKLNIKKRIKLHHVFIVAILLLALIGYFAYQNIPAFSVRIASARAGINATFPSYQLDGYSISGPVTYNESEVVINFKSNTNRSKFAITQTKSSWDSTAVKNMITRISNNQFQTIQERGLTIFTYNGNAAWVNGGILYAINGDAILSRHQIGKIASSM